jgi:hypothetical protein
MKPLKSGLAFSNWLLRIAIVLFLIITFKNLDVVKAYDFHDKEFYISSAYVIFGILLFIGGFASKPALTVISGFILTGLSLYKIFILFSGNLTPTLIDKPTSIANYFIILSVGFYFACSGNE